jgi:hypothetical protein
MRHPECDQQEFKAAKEAGGMAPSPFSRRSFSSVGTRFIASVIHQLMFQAKHLMK